MSDIDKSDGIERGTVHDKKVLKWGSARDLFLLLELTRSFPDSRLEKSDDHQDYISAINQSKLGKYFSFLTGGSDPLPIPQPTEDNENLVGQILAKNQVDEAVFKLYGLDEIQQVIVEDMVNVTMDYYHLQENSTAVARPNREELVQYAQSLISIIQPFLLTLNQRSMVADIFENSAEPLQIVKFSLVPNPIEREVVQIVPVADNKAILNHLAQELPKIAERIHTCRNMRIYLSEEVYLVKSAQLINWTRSAGLNDADTIISESMKPKSS